MPNCFYFSTGVPPPTLQWFKDAVSINKLRNPRYQLLAGGGLRVRQLRPEDSGIFQCLASNTGGEVQTHTYLDVTSECCPPTPPRAWPLDCHEAPASLPSPHRLSENTDVCLAPVPTPRALEHAALLRRKSKVPMFLDRTGKTK